MSNLDLLLPARTTDVDGHRYGVVHTVSPCTVILDGDTAASPCTALITPVVGTRVLVLLWGRQRIILGSTSADAPPAPPAPPEPPTPSGEPITITRHGYANVNLAANETRDILSLDFPTSTRARTLMFAGHLQANVNPGLAAGRIRATLTNGLPVAQADLARVHTQSSSAPTRMGVSWCEWWTMPNTATRLVATVSNDPASGQRIYWDDISMTVAIF